jgi:hypothetical protein
MKNVWVRQNKYSVYMLLGESYGSIHMRMPEILNANACAEIVLAALADGVATGRARLAR